MYGFFVSLLTPFPLVLLALTLGTGFLWYRHAEQRRRLWVVIVPLAAMYVLCLPPISHLALASLERNYPPIEKRPAEAQAIVVLAGSAMRPDGWRREAVLTPDSIYRCLHAAKLYHGGAPCPVFASGGKVNEDDVGPSLSQLMQEFLLELEIPASDLRIEDRSRDTHENAVETAAMLKAEGIKHVVLVTDGMHLPRAIRCFEQQGIQVTPAGCFYRVSSWKWSAQNILPSLNAAVGVHAAFHEWLGLLYYQLRGWI